MACLGATVVWLAVLVFATAARRRAPLAALGILWVFVALLPVLNIVPIGVLMAERLLYLPSVGFAIAAGAGAAMLLGLGRWRLGLEIILMIAFVALTVKTWTRNADWRDALTLWQAELRQEPLDPVVNNNMAVEYTSRGQLGLARERLEVALRVAPAYWRAYVNMGIVAHQLHDDTAAVRWLEQAQRIAPAAASPHYFMGVVLADGGDFAGAVQHLARAEEAEPLDARTHLYQGWYLYRLGRWAEAKVELQRAAELDPGDRRPGEYLAEIARKESALAPGTKRRRP